MEYNKLSRQEFFGEGLDDSVVAVVSLASQPHIQWVKFNATGKVPYRIYLESCRYDIQVVIPFSEGSTVLAKDSLDFLGYLLALFFGFGQGAEPKFFPCEFFLDFKFAHNIIPWKVNITKYLVGDGCVDRLQAPLTAYFLQLEQEGDALRKFHFPEEVEQVFLVILKECNHSLCGGEGFVAVAPKFHLVVVKFL